MTDTTREMPISALLVGEDGSDRLLLREIFRKCGWKLFEAHTRRSAMQALERNPVQVVIAASDLPKWDWRKVLRDLRRLAFPPQLVVTSRTADEHLWAEVLNVGAYDVLPQPLDSDEVEHVVAAASRHFERECQRARGSVLSAAGLA